MISTELPTLTEAELVHWADNEQTRMLQKMREMPKGYFGFGSYPCYCVTRFECGNSTADFQIAMDKLSAQLNDCGRKVGMGFKLDGCEDDYFQFHYYPLDTYEI